jgi:superfamily I DNA and RNA helicase
MSAQHTPGPWSHELTDWCTPSVGHPEHGVKDSLILGSDCREVARVERVYNGPRDLEMERANARLIAAAPDLLAALQSLIDRIEDMPGLLNDLHEEMAEAYLAVRKAEGLQ